MPAVHHASTYVVDSAAELAGLLDGTIEGYSYARIDNPTADAFAAGVAALGGSGSGVRRGQAFASGMAAISTTLLSLLQPGDHVVAPASCYGGTYQLLRGTLARFGIMTTFADQSDAAAMAAALTERTKVIWAEAFANPTMLMADIPALAAVAHAAGALLVCRRHLRLAGHDAASRVRRRSRPAQRHQIPRRPFRRYRRRRRGGAGPGFPHPGYPRRARPDAGAG